MGEAEVYPGNGERAMRHVLCVTPHSSTTAHCRQTDRHSHCRQTEIVCCLMSNCVPRGAARCSGRSGVAGSAAAAAAAPAVRSVAAGGGGGVGGGAGQLGGAAPTVAAAPGHSRGSSGDSMPALLASSDDEGGGGDGDSLPELLNDSDEDGSLPELVEDDSDGCGGRTHAPSRADFVHEEAERWMQQVLDKPIPDTLAILHATNVPLEQLPGVPMELTKLLLAPVQRIAMSGIGKKIPPAAADGACAGAGAATHVYIHMFVSQEPHEMG
eukprot:364783-Chlamydomonas_euryale.AAC.9